MQWVESGEEDTQLQSDVTSQLAVVQASKAQKDAFHMAQDSNFAAASAVMSGAVGALRGVGTLRAMGFAACMASMRAMLKDKVVFHRKQNDYAVSAHGARKDRATGGAFMLFFSTAAQKTTQDSFTDRWDEVNLQPGQAKPKDYGGSEKSNRSKKSTVPRYRLPLEPVLQVLTGNIRNFHFA